MNPAISDEVRYEKDNYETLGDVESFLNESGFTFAETEYGLQMKLTKQVDDKHVEIVFEAR